MSIETMKNDDKNAEERYATAVERQTEAFEKLLKCNEETKAQSPTRVDQLKTASLNTALHCHKASENIPVETVIRDADEIYAWLIGV